GDYRNPGWFRHPPGSQAYEWTGALAELRRVHDGGGQSMPLERPVEAPVGVQVRKPGGHAGH
ncbi:hypothetical protein, partial [Bowmanella yangjiangensis]